MLASCDLPRGEGQAVEGPVAKGDTDVTSDPVTRCRHQTMLTPEERRPHGVRMKALDAISKNVASIAPSAVAIVYDEARPPDAARHIR